MKKQRLSGLNLLPVCIFLLVLFGCKKAMTDSISEESLMTASRSSSSTEPPPPVPTSLRLDPTFTQTPFSARLTWNAPDDVDVLVYRGNTTQIEAVVSVNYFRHFGRWDYTLNNLQQNTTYTFQVQSQAFSGVRSAKTEPFTFTTLPTNDHTPPQTPVLRLESPIAGFIIATWTSSDNFDPASEITYKIFNAITGQLVITLKGSTRLESSFDNCPILEDCVPYMVKALDRSGNLSAASNVAKVSFTGCN